MRRFIPVRISAINDREYVSVEVTRPRPDRSSWANEVEHGFDSSQSKSVSTGSIKAVNGYRRTGKDDSHLSRIGPVLKGGGRYRI